MNTYRPLYPTIVILTICIFVSPPIHGAQTAPPKVDVKMITDEPEAVLSILEKRKANRQISEDDWRRLFQSEGYVRLKRRELGMKRSFEDADFKTFVLSDALLERAPESPDKLVLWSESLVNLNKPGG